MCYSAAPSTTKQNATPKDIYKGYKLARKSLQAYSIKCSMKMYLNDRCCSCYTCLPRTTPAAAQTGLKMNAAPGTITGAPQMDQRLLTNTWPKARPSISIQANTNKS